jgi:hypothetical protein
MFSPQEDEDLMRLVHAIGDANWVHVAQHMAPGFTARQCRERWRNYLDPRLGHEPWTEAEDARLLEEFHRVGTRWTMIAEQFPGRSGNTIRNRYFLLQRKTEKRTRDPHREPPAPFPPPAPVMVARIVPRVQWVPPPPEPPPPPPQIPEPPPRMDPQQKTGEASFSLFGPDNFTDLSQENVMSLFFPRG